MPANFPLDLDPTGASPNNLIVGEVHTLSATGVRAIATRHGPFVVGHDTPVVMDGGTRLTRGHDYQIVELHQEATLRFNKEIAEVILIINPAVGQTATVTYQALGGPYAKSYEAIANLYESVMQDARPIDWVNGVTNKPTDYLPSLHRHLLEDLYGFEPVVDYLERIKSAVTLGQTSVLIQVLRELLAQFGCDELPKVLPSSRVVQYDALLYFLSRRKILSNIWIDKTDCFWTKGQSAVFQIDTSGYAVGTPLYWSFYRPDGPVALFTNTSGTVLATGGVVDVQIYVPSENNVNNDKLYLGVKDDMHAAEYKAVSYQIKVKEHVTAATAYGHVLHMFATPNIHDLDFGSFVEDDELRLWHCLRNA